MGKAEGMKFSSFKRSDGAAFSDLRSGIRRSPIDYRGVALLLLLQITGANTFFYYSFICEIVKVD